MDNQIETMSQADFDGLSDSNSRSKVDYKAIADSIQKAQPKFGGVAISLIDFRTNFWTAHTDKKKGHILWALKNVKAADVVAKLVTVKYQGSDAWVLIKPATKAK